MTIKTHPLRFGQKGFTLIEIVMVLVLLGILAAVAVPKYFDLQEEAERAAVKTIEQEFQARLNGEFAQAMLAGQKCETFYIAPKPGIHSGSATTPYEIIESLALEYLKSDPQVYARLTDWDNSKKVADFMLVYYGKTYSDLKLVFPACYEHQDKKS